MIIRNTRVFICLLCALLAPGLALADAMDDRLAALEARIEALEARLADMEAPETVQEPNDNETVRVGGQIKLSETLTVTVTGFETGLRFRYYPSGGFISSTLSAKAGYALLALFVTVENKAAHSVATGDLLNAELAYGSGDVCVARDSFYYLSSRGVYAGDLKFIPSGAEISGCILFALPEEVATGASGKQLLFRMVYGNTVFEHVLRESGSILPKETDAIGF